MAKLFNLKDFISGFDKFGTIIGSGSYVLNSCVINFLIQELIDKNTKKISEKNYPDIIRFLH